MWILNWCWLTFDKYHRFMNKYKQPNDRKKMLPWSCIFLHHQTCMAVSLPDTVFKSHSNKMVWRYLDIQQIHSPLIVKKQCGHTIWFGSLPYTLLGTLFYATQYKWRMNRKYVSFFVTFNTYSNIACNCRYLGHKVTKHLKKILCNKSGLIMDKAYSITISLMWLQCW